MKYNLLCGVVIGISCNFMYSMHEQHEPVQTISVEHFQQLSSKVDQLYTQVNPSVIKSWLMWSGKWAAIGGGFSLASYLAIRYWFDVASPQDSKDAYRQFLKEAQVSSNDFSVYAQRRITQVSSLLHEQINQQHNQQSDQLKGLNDFLQGGFLTVNRNLVGVEKLIANNPALISRIITEYVDRQQLNIETFNKDLKLEFNELRQEVKDQDTQKQEALGYVEEQLEESNGRELILHKKLQAKAQEFDADRNVIQRVFEIAQTQRRQLKDFQHQGQRGPFKALTN